MRTAWGLLKMLLMGLFSVDLLTVFKMVYAWFPSGCPTVSLWLPFGFPLFSCGFPVRFQRCSCGFPIVSGDVLWFSCGCQLFSLWYTDLGLHKLNPDFVAYDNSLIGRIWAIFFIIEGDLFDRSSQVSALPGASLYILFPGFGPHRSHYL